MNKSDHISKMHFILQDRSKLKNFGPSSETDNTAKIEAHNLRWLLQLKKRAPSIQNLQQHSTNWLSAARKV